MNAIQALLRESIDYAGLFPPAAIEMFAALQNYIQYRSGPFGWALGRFITPVSRLAEFEAALRQIPKRPLDNPWRIAALLGTDPGSDVDQVEEFNRSHVDTGVTIDTVEVRATSEDSVGELARRIPPTLQTYLEVPIDPDPGRLVAAIGRRGRRAKVRTGGVTTDAFPTAANLLRFIRRCTEAGVPFKATAGLHHPLRAQYRLTYEPDSPRGTMFGFLNLFLTVAFVRAGMDDAEAAKLLEEGSVVAIKVQENGIGWRGSSLNIRELSDARRLGVISFGSCSFTEPIEDLESLGLLQTKAQRA
jgi:hypothetical protein